MLAINWSKWRRGKPYSKGQNRGQESWPAVDAHVRGMSTCYCNLWSKSRKLARNEGERLGWRERMPEYVSRGPQGEVRVGLFHRKQWARGSQPGPSTGTQVGVKGPGNHPRRRRSQAGPQCRKDQIRSPGIEWEVGARGRKPQQARECYVLSRFSCVQLFATPLWTVAHQVPLFMGFSRQEYWSGLPCLSPEDLSQPRDPVHISYSALAGGFFTTSARGLVLATRMIYFR